MSEPTVALTKSEYEDLIRENEQLQAVKRYIVANKYISTSDITAILDIKGISTAQF